MTLGLLLIVAALGLSAYNLVDDRRAGDVSAQVIEQLEMCADSGKASGGVSEPSAEALSAQGISPEIPMPTEMIDGHAYIGTLRIPSLGLELPVMSDWSDDKLRLAPCRYSGSAYSDDMVIAAHSYASHFGKLRSISYGAEVSFTDVRGNVFVYEVASIEKLGPSDVNEMTESAWDLTLFTCTFDGSARVTVRCQEIATGI
ncbi:MAG: sortase [Eggerthellaceae bacterium]|nr:sortase [Eggerthellaceae bacterium]